MKAVSIVPDSNLNSNAKPQQMSRANHRALKSMDFRDPAVRAKLGPSAIKVHHVRHTEAERQQSKEAAARQNKTPSREKEREKEDANIYEKLYQSINFEKDLEHTKVSLKMVEKSESMSKRMKIALLQSMHENLSKKIKMLKKVQKQPARPTGSPSLFFSPSKGVFTQSIIKLLDENKQLSPLVILREKTHMKHISCGSSFNSESTSDKSSHDDGVNLRKVIESTEEAILEMKTYRNEILLELDDVKDLLIFETKSLQNKKKILGEKTKRIELLKTEITDLSKKGILTSRIMRNSLIVNPNSKKFHLLNTHLNTQLNHSRINTSTLVEFSNTFNNLWGKLFNKGKTPEKILDELGNDEVVSSWSKK